MYLWFYSPLISQERPHTSLFMTSKWGIGYISETKQCSIQKLVMVSLWRPSSLSSPLMLRPIYQRRHIDLPTITCATSFALIARLSLKLLMVLCWPSFAFFTINASSHLPNAAYKFANTTCVASFSLMEFKNIIWGKYPPYPQLDALYKLQVMCSTIWHSGCRDISTTMCSASLTHPALLTSSITPNMFVCW